jgi:hypothetical protein
VPSARLGVALFDVLISYSVEVLVAFIDIEILYHPLGKETMSKDVPVGEPTALVETFKPVCKSNKAENLGDAVLEVFKFILAYLLVLCLQYTLNE